MALNTGTGTGTGYDTTGTGLTGHEQHFLIYDISAQLAETVKDSADPYAVFEVGAHSVKTDVAKNAGPNPVWSGDQYRLRKHHGNEFSELKVAVYAKKTLLPDGLIGRAEVPLNSLVGSPQTVRLMNKKGEDMGQLMFQVQEEGAGMGKDSGMGLGTGVGTGTDYETRDTGLGAGVGTLGGSTNEYKTTGQTGVYENENTFTTTTTKTTVGAEDVCDRQTFTTMEDRPVIKEQKIYTREHRPFEKQYAVETKFVGEREMAPGPVDALGVEERIVETTPAKSPCSDAPAIGGQVLAGAQDTYTAGNIATGMGNTGTGFGNSTTY